MCKTYYLQFRRSRKLFLIQFLKQISLSLCFPTPFIRFSERYYIRLQIKKRELSLDCLHCAVYFVISTGTSVDELLCCLNFNILN